MLPNIHSFFFFNDTATTEIYTLSLHDALPISPEHCLPHIQFLFIGSRLCSTLLSDLASRLGPCALLSLHLHLVGKRTCTSKLSIILGTHMGSEGACLGALAQVGLAASVLLSFPAW